MPSSPTYQSLFEFAQKILETPLTAVEELTVLLEKYADQFDEWLTSIEKGEQTSVEIESLLQDHEKVLQVAQVLLDDTARARRGLKLKERGLLRYIDVFPKRVSSLRVRKG